MKPGQIYVHDHKMLRVMKRTDGCKGCVLNSPWLCPNIKVKNGANNPIDCIEQGVIFIKFN